MTKQMYKCGNCASVSEEKSDHCGTCGMKGMITEVQITDTIKKATVKKMYATCRNCGTTEMGDGANCLKCHFPTGIKQQTQIEKVLPNIKIKRS